MTFLRGSSCGPSGLPQSDLKQCAACPNAKEFISALSVFLSLFASGGLPHESAPFLYACRLIPISKKDGGVRPIAVGDTLRRAAAKCLLGVDPDALAEYFTSPIRSCHLQWS